MKHTVKIRALSNVLGLRHGDVVDVIATPRVETLIRGGHLEWVDEAGAKVEYVEAAMDASEDADQPVPTQSHNLIKPTPKVSTRKLRSVKQSDDD